MIEQITGDAAENHIDKLSKKYIGTDKFPRRSKGRTKSDIKDKARENIPYVIIIFMVKW